ncbi:hypothetical protein GCM10007424_20480 [Flavobacterium suaedae]|uniref:Uncharacterized protein n=1 Tax=Flavobacterium suaedae TaxID=1767027 RepID=A0ABQ1K0W6_9FLAO|nr:hypothetical protein [Flavobacterium suaedae]GGB80274.1 hypothetical protein GCM10007424_20480 [Flavobacterium suaedae]
MKKEDLDFELFYYVEPMKLIDDPDESIEMFFKYDKEKTEFEEFAKTCKTEDILWIIVTMFKDNHAGFAIFSSLISSTSQKEILDNGKIYLENLTYRNDIKNLKSKYTKEDFFEYVEFEFMSPLDDIENVVEQSLGEKQWTKNDNKYILKSDSGIEYIEVKSTKFKLKANMNKAKRFI